MKLTTKLKLLDLLQDAVFVAGVVAIALLIMYGIKL